MANPVSKLIFARLIQLVSFVTITLTTWARRHRELNETAGGGKGVDR